jgi:hypothetical protein
MALEASSDLDPHKAARVSELAQSNRWACRRISFWPLLTALKKKLRPADWKNLNLFLTGPQKTVSTPPLPVMTSPCRTSLPQPKRSNRVFWIHGLMN